MVTGIQDQEFTVTDVVEGKEYLFRVSACNKCGAGEPAYMDEPVNVSSPASQSQHRHNDSSREYYQSSLWLENLTTLTFIDRNVSFISICF